ncbi:MAG TPA: TatD family deoxyribonuclease [Candidatus Uhrbacteria bacterium]|nr:TatD family deoxyribonuclease [Candidatus Uhrbacteria bacterium]
MLIDSHAHITFAEYSDDLEDVIKRSFASNTQIINASNNYETSVQAVELAEKYDGMWALVGCHPDDLRSDLDIEKYKRLAQSSNKVIGIGEVGLDYYRLGENADQIMRKQKEVFELFIKLALDLNLPLVLHCRGTKDDSYGAYDEMLEILTGSADGSTKLAMTASPGVIHCYGGNLEQAKKFLDLGFYIGITGIVTFKNAKELQQIVREIPLDKILVETDAPFLAPEPFRGQRNEPAYVKYVARKIADLKELAFDEVVKQTYNNTRKLFRF